jgi:hypothetical protein
MTYRILKNLFAFAMVLLMMVPLTGCSDDDSPADATESSKTIGKVGRSVLVYLLADNSLGGSNGYDRNNLADMITADSLGLFGNNRLIIYHDDKNADNPMLKEVTPYGLKILKEYDHATSSVTSTRMNQVIADFKEVAPAEHYGLILWSHATGWLQTGIDESATAKPQWFGEDRAKYMNITTLANVLDGKGFDYVYFDCCFMASVESLYQLRNVTDKFVASCAELPAAGMPYQKTLPYLMADEADLEGAAKAAFDHYNAMSGIDRTMTISVVDAAGLEPLAAATRAIYRLHPALASNYNVQYYERTTEHYLYDFEDYITGLYQNSSEPSMRSLYANWLLALDGCVTYHAATPYIFNRLKINTHSGLSTYILRTEEDADVKNYRQLEWYTDVASLLFGSAAD